MEDINVFNPATSLFQEEDAEMGALGFVIGGGLNDYFSLEFEYITNVTDEDFGSLPGSLEAEGWGIFLAAKTRGDVCVKGRVGYTQTEFEGGDTLSSGSTTNYGIAGGAGVGLKLGPGAVELEYTLLPEVDSINGVDLDSDIDNYLITLGYVWTYE